MGRYIGLERHRWSPSGEPASQCGAGGSTHASMEKGSLRRTGRPLDGWSEPAAPSVRVEIGSPNLHRCECGETQAGAPITTLVPQMFHAHLTIITNITYVSVLLSFWIAPTHAELLVCCDGTVRVGAH